MVIIVLLLMIVAAVGLSVLFISRMLPIRDFFHWSPERWEHEDPPILPQDVRKGHHP